MIVRGGVGTFKTTACTIKLGHFLTMNPGAKAMVLMMTETQINTVFIDAWEQVMEKSLWTEKTSRKEWAIHLFNGSKILLQYAQHKDAAARIRGSTLAAYYVSQAETLARRDLLIELEYRVRQPNVPHLRMIDANGGIPSMPAVRMFIEPGPQNIITASRQVQTGDINIRLCETTEAPLVDIHIRTTGETSIYTDAKIESWRRTLPETEFDRMVEGRNAAAEGLIFREFNPAVHVATFDPDPDWTWICGIDWGYDHPFCCLWIGMGKDGDFHVYDELYGSELTSDQYQSKIKAKNAELGIKPQGFADPSRPMEIRQLQTAARMSVKKAMNKVESGLDVLHGRFDIKGDGKPRLRIHESNCPNLVRELLSFRRDDQGHIVKENDDAVDALRYGISTIYKKRRLT